MKTKLRISLLILSVAVAFSLNAFADDGEGDHQGGDSQGQHGDSGGCDGTNSVGGSIDGSEALDARIILVPTNGAPANAIGKAHLESDNENGTQTAKLSLKVRGLDAGDYTLSLTKISDGSSVVLGQITVGSAQGDDSDGDEQGGQGSGVLQTETDVQLPSDLVVTDIAQIVVSDTNGNAVLVGDLVNPTAGSAVKFKASIRVKPQNGAPTATGKAQLQSTARKGKRTARFTMIASGVPAQTTFNVTLNGKTVTTAKSNKKGKLLVRKLPPGISSIRSVQLTDPQGLPAAQADF
jgi:hypothetical protein